MKEIYVNKDIKSSIIYIVLSCMVIEAIKVNRDSILILYQKIKSFAIKNIKKSNKIACFFPKL